MLRLLLLLTVAIGFVGCFGQRRDDVPAFVDAKATAIFGATKEQESEIRELIEQLVFAEGNASNYPVSPPGFIEPGVREKSEFDLKRFESCIEAFDKLSEMRGLAFPILLEHFDDKRQSINFANHYIENSVGDACYWIIHYQLRDHPDDYSEYGYSRTGSDGKDHPKPYWNGTPFDDAGGLKEWMIANKELNYTEMQIKCLEWLLAAEKKIGAPDSKSYALNILPLETRLLRRRFENAEQPPLTWILLYFNWLAAAVLFAGLAYWTRNTKGLIVLIAAAVLQILAVALCRFDWKRLEGQPDQLYVWIVPFGMAILSIVLILFAFGRNLLTRSGREINPDDVGLQPHRPPVLSYVQSAAMMAGLLLLVFVFPFVALLLPPSIPSSFRSLVSILPQLVFPFNFVSKGILHGSFGSCVDIALWSVVGLIFVFVTSRLSLRYRFIIAVSTILVTTVLTHVVIRALGWYFLLDRPNWA